MKNFKEFVANIVLKWSRHKKKLLESQGLGGLSNRQYGDLAEDYILEKVQALGYDAYKTPGSRSPADIIAVTWHYNFWHIILIQVKSSHSIKTIYRLNQDDKDELSVFNTLLKNSIKANNSILNQYNTDPIIISSGCAYVVRKIINEKITHTLDNAYAFNFTGINIETSEIKKEYLKLIHKLSV
ncbi:MAG: hypothetical protein MUC49_22850 [Raineya sp.]|jgi:hypothetical protein|nr:hypothetical protein [Raineya sp.]